MIMMRVLALLPGGDEAQLQTLPALAALAGQLSAQLQVVCSGRVAHLWTLLPAVERCIPFDFEVRWSLADWANLLGSIREQDIEACLNFAPGSSMDWLLSLSHVPLRVAPGGFSATARVQVPDGWRSQSAGAWLQPLGVDLNADAYRLSLPQAALDEARPKLPAGNGPALLLAPSPEAAAGGWPPERWQQLVNSVRERVPQVRLLWQASDREAGPGPAGTAACAADNVVEQAAAVACVDVVFTGDPRLAQLAVLTGTPLVAVGMDNTRQLPRRDVVKTLPRWTGLQPHDVLAALGL